MGKDYGPVESWIRFLLITVTLSVIGIGMVWLVTSWGVSLWIAALGLIPYGIFIVIAYERLIGWD